jgi:hypothetical protein
MALSICLALSVAVALYSAYRACRWLGRTRAPRLENLQHG